MSRNTWRAICEAPQWGEIHTLRADNGSALIRQDPFANCAPMRGVLVAVTPAALDQMDTDRKVRKDYAEGNLVRVEVMNRAVALARPRADSSEGLATEPKELLPNPVRRHGNLSLREFAEAYGPDLTTLRGWAKRGVFAPPATGYIRPGGNRVYLTVPNPKEIICESTKCPTSKSSSIEDTGPSFSSNRSPSEKASALLLAARRKKKRKK